jgi:hypothetical protein
MVTERHFINTGLQPGVAARALASAVSTASTAVAQTVETVGPSGGHCCTGLKPGVNKNDASAAVPFPSNSPDYATR